MKCLQLIALLTLTIMLPGMSSGLHAQGLRLTPGAHLVMNGAPILVLNNAPLINDGNISAGNGTVLFTGNAPATTTSIGGTNPILFYNLTIGKSANDLRLDNDAAISGRITLDSGNLQLNGYTLDLGSTGSIIGERNEARIIGVGGGLVTLTAALNNPRAFNPGNIGVEFTSPANMGTTLITRGHVQQTDAGGQTSIQRFFDIVPETNAGLQASLRFYYFDGELAGNDKNELAVFSSKGTGLDWAAAGKDDYSASSNWVIKGGLDQLHRYTLAIPGPDRQLAPTTTATAATVYPNPSHDVFTLSLTSAKEGRVAISLFDMRGHVLQTKEIYLQTGANTLSWNIDQYPAGVYWLGIGGLGIGGTGLRAGFGAIKVVKQ